MKSKGRDSKKFQNSFFKQQVKCNGVAKELQNAEQNRSKFWGHQKDNLPVSAVSNEIVALNVIALLSTIPR